MPTKSCLVVELRDTSLADASSVLYQREVIDVSGVDLGDKYHYKLKSKRPKNVHNSFSVSATLNVGWCAKSSSGKWIQSKDYLTDTTFNIDAWKSGNEFQRDLTMVYYCECMFVRVYNLGLIKVTLLGGCFDDCHLRAHSHRIIFRSLTGATFTGITLFKTMSIFY